MPDETVRAIFAQNIKNMLSVNGMSQLELANRVGVGPATVNDWVKGRGTPRANILQRLTEIFDCSLSDLLCERAPDNNIKVSRVDEREVLAEGGLRVLLDADSKLTQEQLNEIVSFIRYQQQKNDRQ